MSRKPRLDAPGALHHVIARGLSKASCINRQINTGGIGTVEKEILKELEISKHTVHQRPQ